MNTIDINGRKLTLNELKEIVLLMEHQEMNDKIEGFGVMINGDYADIEVIIDDMGDVTLL